MENISNYTPHSSGLGRILFHIFINYLDDGTKSVFIRFLNIIQFRETENMLWDSPNDFEK